MSPLPGDARGGEEGAGTATLIASSANIAAFNLGNAVGAQLGGTGISAGGGPTAPVWIGVALSGAGALLAAASIAWERRHRPVLAAARRDDVTV